MKKGTIFLLLGALAIILYLSSTGLQSSVMPPSITDLNSCNTLRNSKIDGDYSVCSHCFKVDQSFIDCATGLNMNYNSYKSKYLFFYQSLKSESCGDASPSTYKVAKNCLSSFADTGKSALIKIPWVKTGLIYTFTCTKGECFIDTSNLPFYRLCTTNLNHNPFKQNQVLVYNELLSCTGSSGNEKYQYGVLKDQTDIIGGSGGGGGGGGCTPSRPSNTCGTDNCGKTYANCASDKTCSNDVCVTPGTGGGGGGGDDGGTTPKLCDGKPAQFWQDPATCQMYSMILYVIIGLVAIIALKIFMGKK